MTTDVEPFRIAVADDELDDLRRRLRQTRWPEPATVDDWSQGVPIGYLQELCAFWADEYDWRRVEEHLNALPQFRTVIDGLGIHFLHVRSSEPDAIPLMMTHGWPGSIIEYVDLLGPLTEPRSYGGSPSDAFHVVCPSLPGYGFSDKPTRPGWGIRRIARAWSALIARLGYRRYGAHGSDWGTSISTMLGRHDRDHVIGLHLVPPLAALQSVPPDAMTAAERTALDDLEHAQQLGSGYSVMHATRPQTIGYALVDSPVGLCAWIVEKFAAWSDGDGHPEAALNRDVMLDNITLYWLTRSAASSARLYWESIEEVSGWFATGASETIDVPVGCSIFPREVPRVSRRQASQRFTDIRHWNELDRGGHFAAMEQPELLVDEVRAAFRHAR